MSAKRYKNVPLSYRRQVTRNSSTHADLKGQLETGKQKGTGAQKNVCNSEAFLKFHSFDIFRKSYNNLKPEVGNGF